MSTNFPYIVSILNKIVEFFRNIIMETEMMLAAAPVVEPLVDKLVTPLLKKFAKKCHIAYKDLMIPRAEHFQNYFKRKYEDFSIINTLVFHNSQRKLKEIYVAQSLVKHYYYNYSEITKIDKFPSSLIKKYKKILIKDTAGMGKSTIMKFMFNELIDQGLTDVGIPIFIELNKLNEAHTIFYEIQEELSSLSEKFDNDMLLSFIETGGFIFFLDGFDEISPEGKDKAFEDIKNFISKAGENNYFILTSRPDDKVSGFGDFQGFSIQNLSKEEAYDLLKKYDLSFNKVVSSDLLNELKTGKYDSLDDFLVNPLLVSLLFTAYDYNQIIPLEKHRFYSNVFEAYFEKHDSLKTMKSRIKLSRLNYDGFYRVLRYVGFDCLKYLGVRFTKEQILNSIGRAKAFCGNLYFSESDFLRDMVTSVPLFCKEGNDYKWVHKSLMEYFAANFIFCDAKQQQDTILTAIVKSHSFKKYYNMLDIYYDIDYNGFSKNIILPFCEKFLKYYKNNYKKIGISKKLIDRRIGCMYMRINYLHRNCFFIESDISRELMNDYPNYFFDPNLNPNIGEYYLYFDNSIVTLLNKRKPELIKYEGLYFLGLSDRKHYVRYEIMDAIYSSQKEGKLGQDRFHIDAQLGSMDEEAYGFFTDLLSALYYPDYTACKKEVEKIKTQIENNYSRSDLSIGI